MVLIARRKRERSRSSDGDGGSYGEEAESERMRTSGATVDGEDDVEAQEGMEVGDAELLSGNSEVDPLSSNVAADSADLYRVLGQQDFSSLKKISVTSKWVAAGTTFPADLSIENQLELDLLSGLHPLLMETTKKNIQRWFPVQKAVLPSLIQITNFSSLLPPRDLAISAPTGSGKTLCYLIPIINSLSRWVSSLGIYALVVAPVQTLVMQIENEFNRFNCFNIPTAVLSGSHDVLTERRQLETAVVVFATPGRLTEHLFDCDFNMNLSNLKYLVVDEADRMHHIARLEWLDAVEIAANATKSSTSIDDLYSSNRLQKILVSATLSHDVENLYIWRLRYPRLFRATKTEVWETQDEQNLVNDLETAILPSSLTHRLLICEPTMKPLAVYSEVVSHPEWVRILIFVNNKLASQRLTLLLKALGKGAFGVEELSSNLFGHRRSKILNRFKKGVTKVLISSDVLSRGVDVEDIDVIFNYDKPKNGRHFIHRVGRTARCGKQGTAISVVTLKEKRQLERLLDSIDALDRLLASSFEITSDDPLLQDYKAALDSLKKSVEVKGKKP